MKRKKKVNAYEILDLIRHHEKFVLNGRELDEFTSAYKLAHEHIIEIIKLYCSIDVKE